MFVTNGLADLIRRGKNDYRGFSFYVHSNTERMIRWLQMPL